MMWPRVGWKKNDIIYCFIQSQTVLSRRREEIEEREKRSGKRREREKGMQLEFCCSARDEIGRLVWEGKGVVRVFT